MTIFDIISIIENRIKHLDRQRETSERIGDMPAISAIDKEISESEATLAQLKTLLAL